MLLLTCPLRRGRVTLSGELAGAHLGVQARDVLLHGRDAAGVVELAGGELEPQVEQLGTGVLELLGELGVVELADLCRSSSMPHRRSRHGSRTSS